MSVITYSRWLEIYNELTGATEDPSSTTVQIESVVDAVNIRIENLCGRSFSGGTHTEYVDGGGTCFIMVNNYPISSLTSIEYVDTDEDVLSTVDVTDCTYFDDGLVKYNGGFGEGKRNIKVVYTTAASADSADLEMIAYRWITYIVDRMGKNEALTSESLGDYSYSLSQGNDDPVLAQIRKDLIPYKRYC